MVIWLTWLTNICLYWPQDTGEFQFSKGLVPLSTQVAGILIATDKTILDTIKAGYASDDYCLKIAASQMPGTTCVNGLWYAGDCLLIPWIGNIGEKSVLSGTWLFKAFWHWVNLMLHYMMLTIGQTWGMISKKPTFHLVRNANATNPIQLRPLGLCTHFLFLIVGGP